MSKIPCTVEQFNQAFCEFHKKIEMMKNPKNKQQWIQNVFAGDPPTGYARWRDWIDSSEKRGAFIRKAEFEDWSGIIKPAEPEWDGETFIQAGHRLQARVNDNPWLSGEITYRSDSGVVFRPDDGGDELFWRFALFNVEFRPLRTAEQRQRDELISIMAEIDGSSIGSFADAILSRYNLEPKQ